MSNIILKYDYDVIVIGAGPAGALAAYTLADRGINTLIIEKALLPRYKTCGGGLVERALQFIPFGIDDVIETKCFTAEMYDHKAGLHFSVTKDKPIISMVMRKDFDNYLTGKALEKGASLIHNCEVKAIMLNKNNCEVITPREKFTCRFIVGADGANGITARSAGVTGLVSKIPALEYELTVSNEDMNRLKTSARFDFGVVPFGYGWVFPKKDHLSVGVAAMKKKNINLNEKFDAYIKALDIKKIINADKHGFVIPINPKGKIFVYRNLFLTGDAAGFADPITAEGISYSLLSGTLAGEAIAVSGLDMNKAGLLYKELLNKKIIRELKYAAMLGRIIYSGENIREFIFRRYGRKFANLMTDVITGRKEYSSLLTRPANFMKLLFPKKDYTLG